MYNFPCSKEYLGYNFIEWAESKYSEETFDSIADVLMSCCISSYRSKQLPVSFFLRVVPVPLGGGSWAARKPARTRTRKASADAYRVSAYNGFRAVIHTNLIQGGENIRDKCNLITKVHNFLKYKINRNKCNRVSGYSIDGYIYQRYNYKK